MTQDFVILRGNYYLQVELSSKRKEKGTWSYYLPLFPKYLPQLTDFSTETLCKLTLYMLAYEPYNQGSQLGPLIRKTYFTRILSNGRTYIGSPMHFFNKDK